MAMSTNAQHFTAPSRNGQDADGQANARSGLNASSFNGNTFPLLLVKQTGSCSHSWCRRAAGWAHTCCWALPWAPANGVLATLTPGLELGDYSSVLLGRIFISGWFHPMEFNYEFDCFLGAQYKILYLSSI